MWEPGTVRWLEQCDTDRARLQQARPLTPGTLEKIRDHLRVALTYSSNAIEGNRLTLQETKVALEGQTVAGKPVRDYLEAIGHAEAFDFMWDLVGRPAPLTAVDVRSIHNLVLRRSHPEEAGRYRTTGVRISGSSHVPPDPMAVPAEMDTWLRRWNTQPGLHPIVRAAQLHGTFVDIHPFVDGNGRTARLLTNLDLLRHSYRPALLQPQDRFAYYEALDAARANQWDPLIRHFATAVHRAFVDYWEPYLPPRTISPPPSLHP